MFCPNCGKNCGDAKFCVSCGAKVQQAARAAHWHIGMPCPNCGGNKLDGKYCAFCGTQLLEKNQQSVQPFLVPDSSITPIGTLGHNIVFGTISLEPHRFLLRKLIGFKTYNTWIPFDQVSALQYVRTSSDNELHLIFRWTENKHLPMPERYISSDKTSITFLPQSAGISFHLFQYLRTVIPATAKVDVNVSPLTVPNQVYWKQYINFDDYFERFHPYRFQAVLAMNKETGIEM